jgi:hypothetical protein
MIHLTISFLLLPEYLGVESIGVTTSIATTKNNKWVLRFEVSMTCSFKGYRNFKLALALFELIYQSYPRHKGFLMMTVKALYD